MNTVALKNGFIDTSEKARYLEVIARSSKDINEGLPFFGRVYRFKDQHNRRFIEHIERDRAISIEKFIKKYPIAGKYQVECDEMCDQAMDFYIEPEDISGNPPELASAKPQPTHQTIAQHQQPQQPAYLDAFMTESIRIKTRADVSQEYESRIRVKNDEIEAYMRKVLELTNSMSVINSERYAELDRLRKDHDSQTAAYRDEIATLKQELAVLKIKQESNQPESPWKYFIDKFGEMAPAVFSFLQAQAAQNQPALPQHQEAAYYEQDQPQTNEAHDPMTAQEFINQFAINLVNLAKEKLAESEPELDQVVGFVHNNLEFMKANNVRVEPVDWMNIAAEIANHAIQTKAGADKVASVLFPVINHLVTSETAKTMLKYMPATNVVDALCATYHIKPSDQVKELLVSVIEQFKKLS